MTGATAIGSDSRKIRFSWESEVGAVCANLLALVLPLVTIQLFDRVIPNDATSTLTVLAAVFITAALLEILLRFAVSSLRFGQGMAYEIEMQEKLVASVLEGHPDHARPQNQVRFLEAFETIDRIRQFNTSKNTASAIDLPFAILFLALLFLIAPPLALVLAVVATVAIGATFKGRAKLGRLEQKRRDQTSRSASFMYEALSGSEHLKGQGAEAFMTRRFESLSAHSATTMKALNTCQASRRGLVDGIVQSTPFLMAACGAYFVIGGTMTAGELAAAILLSGRVIRPFTQAIQVSEARRTLAPLETEINDLTQATSQSGTKKALETISEIELRDVTVTDSEGQKIFDRVCLQLKRGDAISLDGANGSGKSVLLKLMAGQVYPDSGKVLINGSDVNTFSSAHLGECIGFLQQSNMAGSSSILDTLTGFRGQDRLPQSLAVAQELGLMRFLSSRSTSFYERAGVDVAHAFPSSVRAQMPLVGELAKQPSLLLFDEANSTLDAEADQALLAALKKRRLDMCAVIVTRRPSYAAICDRHFRLERGKLVEIERRHMANGVLS